MPAAKRIGKSLFPAVVAVFVAMVLSSTQASAQDYHREALRIPFPGDKGRGLEALLIRPAGDGRYPLALISHGAPRDAKERKAMTPGAMYPQAIEFARRGFAALVVMRRGYGDTSLAYAEDNGPCGARDYMRSARASAQDLTAAVAAMKGRSDVTTERMIAVGQSAGGLASVAFAATAPAGLAAAINFAGGRGSRADNDVCDEARLIEAFGQLGKTVRIPMLWVYSENDLFFRPELSRKFHVAFTTSGGRAEFVLVPPFGQDGHSFFARGVAQWTPIIDRFLTAQGLIKEVRPAPKIAALTPPPQLSAKGRAEFARYLAGGSYRAFAVSPNGAFGLRMGTRSPAEARSLALENCTKFAKDCAVYAVDDVLEKPGR